MNDHYDEAVEVSQSLDTLTISNTMNKAGIQSNSNYNADAKGSTTDYDAKGVNDSKNATMNRSQTFLNNQFDEAVELSQSGSEESIETTKLMSSKDQKHQIHQQQQQKLIQQQQELAQQQLNTSNQNANTSLNMTQNSVIFPSFIIKVYLFFNFFSFRRFLKIPMSLMAQIRNLMIILKVSISQVISSIFLSHKTSKNSFNILRDINHKKLFLKLL